MARTSSTSRRRSSWTSWHDRRGARYFFVVARASKTGTPASTGRSPTAARTPSCSTCRTSSRIPNSTSRWAPCGWATSSPSSPRSIASGTSRRRAARRRDRQALQRRGHQPQRLRLLGGLPAVIVLLVRLRFSSVRSASVGASSRPRSDAATASVRPSALSASAPRCRAVGPRRARSRACGTRSATTPGSPRLAALAGPPRRSCARRRALDVGQLLRRLVRALQGGDAEAPRVAGTLS